MTMWVEGIGEKTKKLTMDDLESTYTWKGHRGDTGKWVKVLTRSNQRPGRPRRGRVRLSNKADRRRRKISQAHWIYCKAAVRTLVKYLHKFLREGRQVGVTEGEHME